MVQSETTVTIGRYSWKRIALTVMLNGVLHEATLFGQTHNGNPFMLEEQLPKADHDAFEKLIFVPMLQSFKFLK